WATAPQALRSEASVPTALECPSADQLERFAFGRLAEHDVKFLSSHVLTCDRCAATIGELSGRDTLADALRHLPHDARAGSGDDIVARVIDKACQLRLSS